MKMFHHYYYCSLSVINNFIENKNLTTKLKDKFCFGKWQN